MLVGSRSPAGERHRPYDGSAQLDRHRSDDPGWAHRLPRAAWEPAGDTVHPNDQSRRPHRRSRPDRQPQSHRGARPEAGPRHPARERLLDRRRAGGASRAREECSGRRLHHQPGRLEPEAIRGEAAADAGRARRGGAEPSRADLSERRQPRADRSCRGLRQQPREDVLRGQGRPGHAGRRRRERRAVRRGDRRVARDGRPSRTRSAGRSTRWRTPPAWD